MISSVGSVNFELNSEIYKANYTFIDNGFILILNNCVPFAEQLIADAENLNRFTHANVVAGDGNQYINLSHRSSNNLQINSNNTPTLMHHQECLKQLAAIGVKVYVSMNTDLQLKEDTGFEMMRYSVGQTFGEHIDIIQGHPEWGTRRLSVVMYLNDNYTGGELEFPRQGIKIKPSAKSMVIFPSEFMYPHLSRKIETGTKYAVVTWFT